MRILKTVLLAALLFSGLSACAVVDAGSAVVSVASTAVTTTADVASSAVCAIGCSSDDEKDKR